MSVEDDDLGGPAIQNAVHQGIYFQRRESFGLVVIAGICIGLQLEIDDAGGALQIAQNENSRRHDAFSFPGEIA